MILESTALVSVEPRRSDAKSAASIAPPRTGVEAATTKRSYANVADNLSNDPSAPKPTGAPAKDFSLWQNASFEFGDFLDIVNPLQHIPIVATIYRHLTDDRIGMAPRVIGGALWGRLTGLVTGVVNSLVEWFTGKDIGDHIYAKIWGEPANANAVARAAKLVSEKNPVAAVAAPELTTATVPEPVAAPGEPACDLIEAFQAPAATTTAIPQTVLPEYRPRPFHHLPYRRSDDFGEPQDGIGKLNINA
ncbi:MAG: hypothetical protein M3N35_10970 [Candidatus Binatota bacterium]|nr:hypothetical protein [Candidatus Binatota bacterium]